MKYFTQKLIDMINTFEQAELGAKMWEDNCKAYQDYLDSVQDVMPQAMKNVFGEEPYHDWLIREISLKPGRNPKKLELTLGNRTERAHLIFEGVSSIELNIRAFSECMMNRLWWLYSEIMLLENGQYQVSVLFDTCDELTVVFEKFAVK